MGEYFGFASGTSSTATSASFHVRGTSAAELAAINSRQLVVRSFPGKTIGSRRGGRRSIPRHAFRHQMLHLVASPRAEVRDEEEVTEQHGGGQHRDLAQGRLLG